MKTQTIIIVVIVVVIIVLILTNKDKVKAVFSFPLKEGSTYEQLPQFRVKVRDLLREKKTSFKSDPRHMALTSSIHSITNFGDSTELDPSIARSIREIFSSDEITKAQFDSIMSGNINLMSANFLA